MLARLEDIPGVAETRVDSSGRFFRIEIRDDHDAAVAADAIHAVLGGEARRLPDREASDQLAAALRGDPWLSVSEVMTLSYVEARIVAVRVAEAAAAEVPALGGTREALAEAIRLELFDTMERVHRAGGRPNSGWIYEAWPGIAQAALSRCAGALPPAVAASVAACLPRLLSR